MSSFQAFKDRIDAHYPLYIDGQWTDAQDGACLEVLCPANGQPLCRVAAASRSDVDRAVAAARAALPAWRGMPLRERYRVVMALHRRALEALDALTVAESLETGRPTELTRSFLSLGMERFPYFGGILHTFEDGMRSEAPGLRAMLVREPVGVVAVLCAWNLPLLWALMQLAPALAAGNTVVLKPSRYTPIGAMELTKAIAELLPPGVLNVLTGEGEPTGRALADHPGVDRLTISGAAETRARPGMAAARRSAAPEAGGRSAGIYFADIPLLDLPGIVQAIALGCVANSGQNRAMQSRVLIEAPIYDWVVMRVAKALEKIRVGPPWQADAQMGPVSSQAHMGDVLRRVRRAQEEGARLVQGGVRLTGHGYEHGYYIAPTALADVNPSMRIAREELLGPVLCLMRFEGEREAIEIVNDGRRSLSVGVFTGDLQKGLRVAESLRAGSVSINRALGQDARSAMGFWPTDMGWPRDREAFDGFCRMKAIAF